MTDTEEFTLPLHMRRDRFLPDAELERIRDSGDVPRVRTAFGAEAYLVTRYDDVRHVLGDAATYSNAGSAELTRPDAPPLSEREQEQMRAGQLLLQDPPEHTRLRRFLTREFTQRRMARLEPRITEIVDEHLDALEAAGPGADLVSLFALPVPSMVI